MNTSTRESAANRVRSGIPTVAQEWFASRPLSESTRRAYTLELTRMESWAKARKLSVSEWPTHLIEFLDDLASGAPDVMTTVGLTRPLQASSLLQCKRILRLFCSWLSEGKRGNRIPDRAIRIWRPPSNSATSLTHPSRSIRADRAFLGDLGEKPTTAKAARRQLALGLAFWLGTTPRELVSLRRTDFARDAGGKGMTCRLPLSRIDEQVINVRLPTPLVTCWHAWLEVAPHSEFAICHLRTGKPMKADAIWRLLNERGNGTTASSKARKSPLGCRRLRAAAISHLRVHGWSVEDIRIHFRRAHLNPAGFKPRPPLELQRSLERVSHGI